MIIKPYYCPHCGNFKWRFQSYEHYEFATRRVCAHCDRILCDTKEEFKDYMDSKRYKDGNQK